MSKKLLQIVGNLQRRVFLTIARGVLKRLSDDPGIQSVQVNLLAGETRDGLERFQNYGFTSVPFEGAEAAVMFVGGNRDHGLVVAIDDRRFRLKNLEPGEVALYTDEGDKIHFKRNREIEITTQTLTANAVNVTINATNQITLDTPLVLATGDIHAQGDIMEI